MHRDVKPANILVTQDDVVKLSDFGIARAVSEHTLGVTQPGMVMGSVAYISPEQAQGHDASTSAATSTRSGVVLYQMLTGKLPFSGDNPVAVALKHVSEPAPAIDPRAAASARPSRRSSPGCCRRTRGSASPRRRSWPAPCARRASGLRSPPRPTRASPTRRPCASRPSAHPSRRAVGRARPPARGAGPQRRGRGRRSTRDGRRFDPRWLLIPALLLIAIAVGFVAQPRPRERHRGRGGRRAQPGPQERDPGPAAAPAARLARDGQPRGQRERAAGPRRCARTRPPARSWPRTPSSRWSSRAGCRACRCPTSGATPSPTRSARCRTRSSRAR